MSAIPQLGEWMWDSHARQSYYIKPSGTPGHYLKVFENGVEVPFSYPLLPQPDNVPRIARGWPLQQQGQVQSSNPGSQPPSAFPARYVYHPGAGDPNVAYPGPSNAPATQQPYSGFNAYDPQYSGGSWFAGGTAASGPSMHQTGQSLSSSNYLTHGRLTENNAGGESNSLPPSYKIRVGQRARKFFCMGKVFQVLWSEPMGNTTSTNVTEISYNRFGEAVHSKIRRFVVIREDDESCTAIAIHTYGRRGLARRGVKKSNHAVIYTGSRPPTPMPEEMAVRGEDPMQPLPIQVHTCEEDHKLDPLSRVNFGKVYTVEHNVKAKAFGMVEPQHINSRLYAQWKNVWPGL